MKAEEAVALGIIGIIVLLSLSKRDVVSQKGVIPDISEWRNIDWSKAIPL